MDIHAPGGAVERLRDVIPRVWRGIATLFGLPFDAIRIAVIRRWHTPRALNVRNAGKRNGKLHKPGVRESERSHGNF